MAAEAGAAAAPNAGTAAAVADTKAPSAASAGAAWSVPPTADIDAAEYEAQRRHIEFKAQLMKQQQLQADAAGDEAPVAPAAAAPASPPLADAKAAAAAVAGAADAAAGSKYWAPPKTSALNTHAGYYGAVPHQFFVGNTSLARGSTAPAPGQQASVGTRSWQYTLFVSPSKERVARCDHFVACADFTITTTTAIPTNTLTGTGLAVPPDAAATGAAAAARATLNSLSAGVSSAGVVSTVMTKVEHFTLKPQDVVARTLTHTAIVTERDQLQISVTVHFTDAARPSVTVDPYVLQLNAAIHAVARNVPPVWTADALQRAELAPGDAPFCPKHTLDIANAVTVAAAATVPAAPAPTVVATDLKTAAALQQVPTAEAVRASAINDCADCRDWNARYKARHQTAKQKARTAGVDAAAGSGSGVDVKASAGASVRQPSPPKPNAGGAGASAAAAAGAGAAADDEPAAAGDGVDDKAAPPAAASASAVSDADASFFDSAQVLVFPPAKPQHRRGGAGAGGSGGRKSARASPTGSIDFKSMAAGNTKPSLVAVLPADALNRILSFGTLRDVVLHARVCKNFASEVVEVVRADITTLDLRWCHGPKQLGAACVALVKRVPAQTWPALCALQLQGTPMADPLALLSRTYGAQLQSVAIESNALTDADVALLCQSSGNALNTLQLARCPKLTNKSLSAVAAHARSLTSLDVSGTMRLNDEGFVALARDCKHLESLNVSQCIHVGDATISALATHCRALSRLNVDRCLKLTDVGLRALAAAGAAAAGAAPPLRLRWLNVNNCHKLKADALIALFQSAACNRSLQNVSLAGVGTVNDAVVVALANACADTLSALDLTGAVKLSAAFPPVTVVGAGGAAAAAVAAPAAAAGGAGAGASAAGGPSGLAAVARLHALTVLSVSKVPAVDDQLLVALSRECTSLQALSVQSCSKVTDIGISALGKGLPQLRQLDAAGVWALTPTGFQSLVTGCRQLSWLSVRLCHLLRVENFAQLAASCPALDTLLLGSVFDEARTHDAIRLVRKLHPNCKIFL